MSSLSEAAPSPEQKLLVQLTHRIGRSLGAARSAAQALQMGAHADAALRGDLLQGIDDVIGDLSHDLDNVAAYLSLQEGSLQLQPEYVDLALWLPRHLAPWPRRVAEAGLKWQVLEGQGSWLVRVDARRLAQVLYNLLYNALRHTAAPGHIRLRLRPEAGAICLDVESSGSGLPPLDPARLFEPLGNGDARYGRFPQGLGLSLNVARRLAWQSGGDLELEQRDGGWFCFHLRLPLATPIPPESVPVKQ